MTEQGPQPDPQHMDAKESCLAGVRVLITRPQAQVPAWQQKLQAAGAEALSVPLMAIVPAEQAAEAQAIKNIILEFDQYQTAIFVSQNAVRYGLNWLDQYWPQLPLGVDYFAIGKATAAALERESLDVCCAEQAMNSEELLALPQMQNVEGKKIVIFRGCGGRPLLGDRLQDRGASVDYCELYHRQAPEEARPQLQALCVGDQGFGAQRFEQRFEEQGSDRCDVISVHSGETLDNLLAVLDKLGYQSWKELPLLVPGSRVADIATAAGFKQIIIAENATDAAMLAALIQWRQHSLSERRIKP